MDNKRPTDRPADDDDEFEVTDPEACPGCGTKPGEGVTPDCDHPAGCGYWKEVSPE